MSSLTLFSLLLNGTETNVKHVTDIMMSFSLIGCSSVMSDRNIFRLRSDIAKYDTKLRWQHKRNGKNRYLKARFDFD